MPRPGLSGMILWHCVWVSCLIWGSVVVSGQSLNFLNTTEGLFGFANAVMLLRGRVEYLTAELPCRGKVGNEFFRLRGTLYHTDFWEKGPVSYFIDAFKFDKETRCALASKSKDELHWNEAYLPLGLKQLYAWVMNPPDLAVRSELIQLLVDNACCPWLLGVLLLGPHDCNGQRLLDGITGSRFRDSFTRLTPARRDELVDYLVRLVPVRLGVPLSGSPSLSEWLESNEERGINELFGSGRDLFGRLPYLGRGRALELLEETVNSKLSIGVPVVGHGPKSIKKATGRVLAARTFVGNAHGPDGQECGAVFYDASNDQGVNEYYGPVSQMMNIQQHMRVYPQRAVYIFSDAPVKCPPTATHFALEAVIGRQRNYYFVLYTDRHYRFWHIIDPRYATTAKIIPEYYARELVAKYGVYHFYRRQQEPGAINSSPI